MFRQPAASSGVFAGDSVATRDALAVEVELPVEVADGSAPVANAVAEVLRWRRPQGGPAAIAIATAIQVAACADGPALRIHNH